MKFNKIVILAASVALTSFAYGNSGSTDFSLASNPNCVWSYGW